MVTALNSEFNRLTDFLITIWTEKAESTERKRSWYENLLYAPLERIGRLFKNAFLPRYSNPNDLSFKIDQKIANQISNTLKGTCISDSEEMHLLQSYFSVRDVDVLVMQEDTFRIFTVRLFTSKKTLHQKKLRLILFSFNGNQEGFFEKKTHRWEPLTLRELSKSPWSVLKAFKEEGMEVDTLMTTSLGNVMLDRLKEISLQPEGQAVVPKTMIINRGFTSVKKIGDRFCSFPMNYFFHALARFSGWNADPEQQLLNFLESEKRNSLSAQRKIVILEVLQDHYFSGKGAFAPDYHDKLNQLGASVFRATFYPFPFHERSHHGISLEHLVHNCATEVLANTIHFSMNQDEKMSVLIAKNIFLAGKEELHTCFYVAGNDATLDIATAREICPLMKAFVKEGKKLENVINLNAESQKIA